MGKEQEQSRRGEEDTRRALDEMLDSMGAEEYDPAVVAALEEYGRRVVTDLLCDAKDFATHACHKDITVDDMHLAIKVRDKKTVVPSTEIINAEEQLINSKPLPPFPKAGFMVNPKAVGSFKSRPYTYVPGQIAYGEGDELPVPEEPTSKTNNFSTSEVVHKKPQIPIILHPEKRGESATNEENKKRFMV